MKRIILIVLLCVMTVLCISCGAGVDECIIAEEAETYHENIESAKKILSNFVDKCNMGELSRYKILLANKGVHISDTLSNLKNADIKLNKVYKTPTYFLGVLVVQFEEWDYYTIRCYIDLDCNKIFDIEMDFNGIGILSDSLEQKENISSDVNSKPTVYDVLEHLFSVRRLLTYLYASPTLEEYQAFIKLYNYQLTDELNGALADMYRQIDPVLRFPSQVIVLEEGYHIDTEIEACHFYYELMVSEASDNIYISTFVTVKDGVISQIVGYAKNH